MTTFLPLSAARPAADALRQALVTKRAQAMRQLYRQAYPPVRRYIGRHGGLEQDAQDIFQDALIVLYEQATSGTLVLTAAASTYLLSVSRNLWHQELRRRARLRCESLPATATLAQEDAEEGEAAEPTLAVLDYVERLGETCKNLLLSFYYFQQPLAQIAETHGYRTVRSATVQKFKCLERLRRAVRAGHAAPAHATASGY